MCDARFEACPFAGPIDMDRMSEIEKGTDLSSFAMLLLESSDVHRDHRRDLETDMVVDHVPDIGDCRSALSPGSNNGTTRGIRNFFRKRHKSSSSSGGGSPTVSNGGGVRMDYKETSPSSSAPPGSKIRTMIPTPRARSRSDDPAVTMEPSVHRCTYTVQSETLDIGNGGGDDMMEIRRGRGSGDSGLPASLPLHQNVYRTPARPVYATGAASSLKHPSYMRSSSVRDTGTPIGPSEFVEMYRSRAYSDPRLVDRNRLLTERRRRLSMSPPLSPLQDDSSLPTVGAFEPRQMIIWKDHVSGTHIFRLPSTDEEEIIDVGNFDQSDDLVFLRFLKCHSCYDVLPTSNKLVILDTQLNVKKAFYALVDNGIRAAPLWDTDAQTIVGLFTVTDFIRILLKYNSASQFAMEDIEDQTIATWTELLSDVHVRPLVSVSPDATMLEAIRQLCLHHVHRIPVVDPQSGNMLTSLTHKTLLKYLYSFFQHYGIRPPTFMDRSVEELGIGTFMRIATVRLDTTLLAALNLLLSRRVSALPVIDGHGRLIGVYSKADVMNLAAQKTYSNLMDTMERVTSTRTASGKLPPCPAALTCQRSESLTAIVDRIVKNGLHRLFAVDSDGRVEGVVSLSDILRRLVLSPEETQSQDSLDSSSVFTDRLIDLGDD